MTSLSTQNPKGASSMSSLKVLLIYPGLFMQTALPIGIASLAAALKSQSIEVKLFDTVLFREPHEIDENLERAEKHHSTKFIDYSSVGIVQNHEDLIDSFTKVLLEFKPNLLALSSVESTFSRGIKLTRQAKKVMDVPIIAGGVFPTMAPEIVLKENSIDMVCIGEGEDVIVELCECLQKGQDYSNILSLWLKKGEIIYKNKIRKLKELDSMEEPDFSIFGKHMFYKAMQGNLFRTIPVELSRGCPYQCTYCAEPAIARMFKNNKGGLYFRKKSINNLLNGIKNNIKKYSAEFIYFTSETFLAINQNEFDEFIEGYRNIRVPFWIQTRPETITYDKISKLKEVGLYWLTIGIEHGNEDYRRKYLKRDVSNNVIIDSMKIINELEQGASLNSIIGMPFESKELIYETIHLNRLLFNVNKRIRCNMSVFIPFRGCELYDLCLKHNLIDSTPYLNYTNITSFTALRFPNLTQSELQGLYRTFPLYVYLPEKYLDNIILAEEFSDSGNNEYAKLNKLVNEYIL